MYSMQKHCMNLLCYGPVFVVINAGVTKPQLGLERAEEIQIFETFNVKRKCNINSFSVYLLFIIMSQHMSTFFINKM